MAPGSFGLPAKRKSYFEIQQMALFQLVALYCRWSAVQQLSAKAPSVGFHNNTFKIGLWCYWRRRWQQLENSKIPFATIWHKNRILIKNVGSKIHFMLNKTWPEQTLDPGSRPKQLTRQAWPGIEHSRPSGKMNKMWIKIEDVVLVYFCAMKRFSNKVLSFQSCQLNFEQLCNLRVNKMQNCHSFGNG